MSEGKSINSIQLMFLLHTVQLGVGILGLVRFVAEPAGHDAALAILVSGIYPQLGILFMWLLLKRFRTLGVYDIHNRLFGKWMGRVFSLLFAGYCLFSYFMILRTFVELVVTWMFPMTPAWILTSLFLVPTLYAAAVGLRLLGRFAVSVFFLTIWIAVMVYVPATEGTFTHILPIGSEGAKAIFQGSLMSALSILGLELLVVFYPYVTHKKDVLSAASIASWATILIYTWVAVATLLFFSEKQLSKTIWPMLTMFKHVQIPFIERFETIIIAIWVLQIVNSAGTYLWAGVHGLEQVFRLKRRWIVFLLVVGVTLYVSPMLESRTEINKYLDLLSKVGLGMLIGYPLLLWLVSLVMRKKGDAV